MMKTFQLAITVRNVTYVLAAITLLTTRNYVQAATIFTNRTAWEAAVSGFSTETFDNPIADATTIILDNGIVSTAVPAISTSIPNHHVSLGRFFGHVGSIIDLPSSIIWTTPNAIIGFFGDFSAINTPGLTVTGDFDGTGNQTLDISATIGGSSGGFGVVGMASFTSFFWGSNDDNEAYSIDNFSTVPEPSRALLALLALGAVLVRRRR